MRIAAPNKFARQGGIQQGMRLADALALLPALVTQEEEPRADAIVLRRLGDWGQRYAPVVGIDGTSGLWIDITGAAHLCGDEDALLADLDCRLRTMGFANRLGLAETSGAAWAIARFGKDDDRNIPAGGILRALAPLPLDALRLDEEPRYLLKRFGLRSIGALCAIPRASLKRRFPSKELGEAVLHRLDQALGRIVEPIVPIQAAPVYCERLSFAEPILATGSFHQGLENLLSRLCQHMESNHTGAQKLTFSAYHADGDVSRVSITTAQPSRDAQHLKFLFRDRIDAINPGFGVDLLVLSADRVLSLKTEQLSLVKSSGMEREHIDLSLLIDRLSNRIGADSVQRIVPHASHIPEQAERRVAALVPLNESFGATPRKPLRPFRLLPRPEPIQVIAEVPEGPPKRFTWRRMTYRVVRAEGPERIAPEWWISARTDRPRDYYRVEDEDGRRFWLFREGLYRNVAGDDTEPLPSWHLHGLFS